MMKTNKKAQVIGTMMTGFVATLAIALIIIVFAVVTPLFAVEKDISKEVMKNIEGKDVSDVQLHKSLMFFMDSEKNGEDTVDMIRLSKINETYRMKTQNFLNESFNEIYGKWAVSAVSYAPENYFITLGYLHADRKADMLIPDAKGKIKIQLGVQDE